MNIKLSSLFLGFILCIQVAKADFSAVANHFKSGLVDLPDTTNIVVLSSATVITVTSVWTIDKNFKNYFADKNRLNGAEKFGNFWGSSIPNAVIVAGLLSYGWLAKKQQFYESSIAHIEAFLVSTVLVQGLKYSVQRERPNAGAHTSFPSGHATSAFTIAGNFYEFFPWYVSIPAIGLGLFTDVSRMASNVHFFSDVVFGSALGFVIARAYSQHHLEYKKSDVTVGFYPEISLDREYSINIQAKF